MICAALRATAERRNAVLERFGLTIDRELNVRILLAKIAIGSGGAPGGEDSEIRGKGKRHVRSFSL